MGGSPQGNWGVLDGSSPGTRPISHRQTSSQVLTLAGVPHQKQGLQETWPPGRSTISQWLSCLWPALAEPVLPQGSPSPLVQKSLSAPSVLLCERLSDPAFPGT